MHAHFAQPVNLNVRHMKHLSVKDLLMIPTKKLSHGGGAQTWTPCYKTSTPTTQLPCLTNEIYSINKYLSTTSENNIIIA